MVNLTGHILTAQNTDNIKFNASLNYYEDIQSFEATERYDDTYWVSYKLYEYSEAALKASHAIGPPEALAVPRALVSELTLLAERIVEGETTDYGKLMAIKDYLLENYEWDEEFAPAPSMIDPIRWFLFNERAGIGSHFNSAFVILARCLGIPMRAVVGYQVDDGMELQYVMPQQAFLWAETEFENLGWITFDASPIQLMDSNANVTLQTTVTNITGSDPIAIRGKQFNVWGTVQTLNGSAVTESQVEIMLKMNKTDINETALIVGVGFVEDGLFNVTCDATPEIMVGDYNLIAHTLETWSYRESWSDPPIKVVAETVVTINGPRQVYMGRNITYRGSIIDPSDGSPVINASLRINYLRKGELHSHVPRQREDKHDPRDARGNVLSCIGHKHGDHGYHPATECQQHHRIAVQFPVQHRYGAYCCYRCGLLRRQEEQAYTGGGRGGGAKGQSAAETGVHRV